MLFQIASVAFVLFGLVLISNKIGAKYAGFLSGLPTGSIITLYLLAKNFGPEFSSTAASSYVDAIPAIIALVWLYRLCAGSEWRLLRFFAPIISLLSYIVTAVTSYALALPLWLSMIAAAIVISTANFFLAYPKSTSPDVDIVDRSTSMMAIQSLIGSVLIAIILWIAKSSGPDLAGIVAAFPVTLFPLLVIQHISQGARTAQEIAGAVSYGLWGFLIYVALVRFTYPVLDENLGTIISAIITLLMFAGGIKAFEYLKSIFKYSLDSK